MRYIKFLLTIFLLFCSVFAFAEVFTVTNNADAGVGTLREALTKAAANDSSQVDRIEFNLPNLSEDGRTIILFSQLPDVSSNLVIDGSTQPGAKFGVSDAHIQLLYQVPVLRSLSGLRIVNHHDVLILGLYINLQTTITYPSNAYSFLYMGIELKNDKNVQIGDAGKGNIVDGFYYPLSVNSSDTIHHQSSQFYFENLILKDNIFGISANGRTLSSNQITAVLLNYIVGQITIGGLLNEGNLFSQGLSIYQTNFSDSTDPRDYYSSTPAIIQVQNNKIGVDYYAESIVAKSSGLGILTSNPNGKSTVYIEDNVIAATGGYGYAIYASNMGRHVTIVRNYIGTDKTRKITLKTNGIFLYWDTGQVSIGSDDKNDANYITNCNPVTAWPYTNATINKNSFYCTINAQPIHPLPADSFPFPFVKILNQSAMSISGTATPNASIELFYSDDCQTCSPQTYFTSTTADINGKWQFNGSISGTVIASATLGKNTSDFTKTSIDVTNIKLINSCNGIGGSIIGAVPLSATDLKWVDESGNVVGRSANLENVNPGKYKLIVSNGVCNAETQYYQVVDAISINVNNLKVGNVSCNQQNGYIAGIVILNNSKGKTIYSWKDASGTEKAQTLDLQNTSAGTYILTVLTADQSCTTTYGPITLKNTTGPNIDQTTVTITPSPCGKSTGSIANLNINGTGTLKYSWKNTQNQEVATTKDLTNQPAGKYILRVTDETTCGPVYSSAFEITETNGVTIDDTQKQITVATCTDNNGSITGIKTAGATSYQWINSTGKVVSTSIDLAGAAPDSYYLLASNSASCSKQSPNYTIARQSNLINIGGTSKSLKDASCGLNNGRIEVLLQSPVLLPKSYRWQNSNGQTLGGNSLILSDIDAGTYSLYGTDDNGCEKPIATYSINRIPPLQIVSGSAQTINDQCSQKLGSIRGMKIQGGVLPYTYNWVNAAGQQLSATADLLNVTGGTYQLQVKDATDCGTINQEFTLTDQSAVLAAPSANDLQLCGPGKSFITVNNPVPGSTYRLYNTSFGLTPLDEQVTGKFQLSIKSDGKFYVTQIIGSCESARTQIDVGVGLSAVNIANTFSPNGDGINDLWILKGIENYPTALVQLFNRYGQKVFESKGYANAFDGNINSKRLPEGTYYYIINLSSACNLISGNLTLIR